MIDFKKLTTENRQLYEEILCSTADRGCEYAYVNLRLWGRQQVAFLQGCAAIFAHFQGRSVYGYPIGSGDRKAVLEAIIEDARDRGIPCRIHGMTKEDRQELEALFPDRFLIIPDRDAEDYVYSIDDLADLRGRKYQRKRNHVNRFRAIHEDYTVEPITAQNLQEARALTESWYESKEEGDYLMEQVALDRAFRHYEDFSLEGILLKVGGENIAMSIGSFMYPHVVDVHFEKALDRVDGAYAAVNSEFARYIREKYPRVQFLDREDDMGLEGLRKAKTSYNPHHMVEKFRACLKEDIDDT